MTDIREQRLDQLRRATVIRAHRAAWKQAMRRMPRPVAVEEAQAMIDAPPWWAESWLVADVVGGIPHVGAWRVQQISRAAHVSQFTALRDLTGEQRDRLRRVLDVRVEHGRVQGVAA